MFTWPIPAAASARSEEHTSELQSPYGISYAGFCLKKKHHDPLPTDARGGSLRTASTEGARWRHHVMCQTYPHPIRSVLAGLVLLLFFFLSLAVPHLTILLLPPVALAVT